MTPSERDTASSGAPATAAPPLLVLLGHDGRPARRLRRDASENQERILAAARRLFADRGREVTMEDVASAAGVGKGTLYRRYPRRAALAQAVLDGLERDLQAQTIAGFDEETRAAGPMARLDRFLQRAAEFADESSDLLCMVQEGGAGEHMSAPPYLWRRQVVAGLLYEAFEAGAIPRPDLDYDPDAILALIDPVLVRHLRRDRELGRAHIAAGLTRLVRSGVGGS